MDNSEIKHCKVCEGGVAVLATDEIKNQLTQLSGWQFNEVEHYISKSFKFKGYARTMAFVNLIAWMAAVENHHPNLEVGYNFCVVKYWTHSIGGVTENDLLCANKIETLFKCGNF